MSGGEQCELPRLIKWTVSKYLTEGLELVDSKVVLPFHDVLT